MQHSVILITSDFFALFFCVGGRLQGKQYKTHARPLGMQRTPQDAHKAHKHWAKAKLKGKNKSNKTSCRIQPLKRARVSR